MSKFNDLNTIVHAPIRLGVLTTLSQVDDCDFNFLKSALEVTDGNLSSHLAKLEAAKYIEVKKGFIGKKQHSRYRISALGVRELNTYLAAIKAIISL